MIMSCARRVQSHMVSPDHCSATRVVQHARLMDMQLDPDLMLRIASRLAELTDALVDSVARVRCTAVDPPGDAGWSPPDSAWSEAGAVARRDPTVARRDAAADALARHTTELALVAAHLRRYAESVREQDRSVADGVRRLESRLPSIIRSTMNDRGPQGPQSAEAPGRSGGWPR
jgi:hypothetical protein